MDTCYAVNLTREANLRSQRGNVTYDFGSNASDYS